jgi:hypothetical protein
VTVEIVAGVVGWLGFVLGIARFIRIGRLQ